MAVSENGAVIYHDESTDEHAHSSKLSLMVESALSFTDNHAIPFDAVSVSSGPGSYTGLRIGVSMAKGVSYGFGVPLIGVPTLELLCVPVLLGRRELEEEALLCPMVDARRMEVYAAIYDRALHPIRETQADVVDADTYREYLDRGPVYFFGPGAAKCMDIINHPNAHLLEGIQPVAKYMFPLAEKRIAMGQTEDVAYFTPFYLKDFVAKKSEKNFPLSPSKGKGKPA